MKLKGWCMDLNCRREALERGLGELGRVTRVDAMRLCAVGLNKEEDSEPDPEAKEVLQTVTMALSDVRKDLSSWIPAMKAEYESLTRETEAVLPVDVRTLDPQQVEFVPGKLVCVVKAGVRGGKKKCRGVICGNMMESDPSPIGVYASGADGTLIRTVLRHAALMKWGCSTTDIKTAFLLAPRVAAPQQREVVVVPPKILVEAGVCGVNERWKILKALYGLPSSPACWAKFRDETMKTFEWETEKGRVGIQQTPEGNLWKIVNLDGADAGKMVGQVLVYVDDLMVLGPPEIRMSFLKRLGTEWTCAPADHVEKGRWTRFSGIEISLGDDGTSIKLSQISYIKELLQRHGEVSEKITPMPKWDTEGSPEEDIAPQQIRAAQMVVGELLWASVRTRPDIAFAVSIMGQQVTKRPKWVCQLGNHVLGFLKHTWDHCLLYPSEVGGHGHDGILQIPRHEALLEAYTDISFAPNGNRSYQGILVFFAGAPVQWEANRQSFHTLSTAESELMAAIEGMSMTQSVEALLKVMYEERVHEKVLYGDNASTISITDGPWRTRHLRLRANYLKEKLKNYPEEWKIRHEKGSTLVADLLTKPVTQMATWRRFWKALSFLVSAAHEVVDSEKDTTYETDGPETKGDSGGCNCVGEELPTESRNAQDTAVKIAKVGLLLGLVEKIPWNPEHSHVKTILCIVFTVLLSFFIWQWRELSESLLAKGRNFCRKLQVSLVSSLEFDNKNQEKKEQEERQKRVRENEPTPIEGRNAKEDVEEKLRKDETPIENPRDEGFFGNSSKVRGGVLEGAVDRRVVRPATSRLFEASVDPEELFRNPVSMSDGSSYHCPTGCPSDSRSFGASAMANVKENFKLAAMRVAPNLCAGDDQKVEGLPELWQEERFENPPKYHKDEWLDCWLDRGWLVRSHGKERVRRFHPVHKGNPVHVDCLEGTRITIGYGNSGQKEIVTDRWTDAPGNHFTPKQLWKGWTFLRLKRPLEPVLGQRFTGEASGSRDEMVGTASRRAGGSMMGPLEMVMKKPTAYTMTADPEPFPGERDSVRASSSSEILSKSALGYKRGDTIDKGQIVAKQLNPQALRRTVMTIGKRCQIHLKPSFVFGSALRATARSEGSVEFPCKIPGWLFTL